MFVCANVWVYRHYEKKKKKTEIYIRSLVFIQQNFSEWNSHICCLVNRIRLIGEHPRESHQNIYLIAITTFCPKYNFLFRWTLNFFRNKNQKLWSWNNNQGQLSRKTYQRNKGDERTREKIIKNQNKKSIHKWWNNVTKSRQYRSNNSNENVCANVSAIASEYSNFVRNISFVSFVQMSNFCICTFIQMKRQQTLDYSEMINERSCRGVSKQCTRSRGFGERYCGNESALKIWSKTIQKWREDSQSQIDFRLTEIL